MELGIAGQRVLVTGGSQGLGRAAALAFAREGCRVAVVARSAERLAGLLEELGGPGLGHAVLAMDLMPAGAPERALAALEGGGAFSIVLHNLGGTLGLREPLAPVAAWAEVWRLNVGIAIELNDRLLPAMVTARAGRIIHVSSDAAQTGRGATPYAAAKAYLNTYVKGLGRHFGPSGVVLSALMPGPLETPGSTWETLRREHPDRLEEYLRHHQSRGRLGSPEEVLPFLLFLASSQATYAAAAILGVDGGSL